MNQIGSCRKMVFLGGVRPHLPAFPYPLPVMLRSLSPSPSPVTLNLFVLCTPPAPGS